MNVIAFMVLVLAVIFILFIPRISYLVRKMNSKLVKKSKDSKQKYKTSEPTASEPTSPEFKSST